MRKSSSNHGFWYPFHQNRLKNGKLWAFKEFNMADIESPFWIFNYFPNFQLLNSKIFISSHHLRFRLYVALCIRKMVFERLMQIVNWFVFSFANAYLISLCDVTKRPIWPLPLQSICQYSNTHNFPIFQPILIILVSKCIIQRTLSYKHTHQ